jgi:ABC-type transport system involved in cytochrome c biogenesis permease component
MSVNHQDDMNDGSLELKTMIKMNNNKLNHHVINTSINVSRNICIVSSPLLYMVHLFCSYKITLLLLH